MDCCDTSWKSIFDFPEDTTTQIDVMFHESHSTVFRPTLSIVVSDHILIIRVRILSKIPLNKLSSFVAGEFEENVKMIDISKIDSNWMPGLNFD